MTCHQIAIFPKGRLRCRYRQMDLRVNFIFCSFQNLRCWRFHRPSNPCASQINWRKNSSILGTPLPLTDRAQPVQTGSRSNPMVRWDRAASKEVLGWIRQQDRQGTQLGGICTGAFALAQAGVIRDRRFTLHWENQPAFVETFPDLVPTENLYENDGQLITCSGGNAATDMMLALIEEDHGSELALVVADMCIHKRSNDRQAPQRSSLSVMVGTRRDTVDATNRRGPNASAGIMRNT